MDNLNSYNERNYITALKAFAVISIVSAHCSTVSLNSNYANVYFSWILNQLGSIGVGVFFIISGYLFLYNKSSIGKFFKKKKTIFIPWVITGSAVYLYTTLRKGNLELTEWINFLLGNGSYLYYLTLLIIFYVLFFYTYKNIYFVILTILLSFVSIVLTSNGWLENINPYLNPLNFMWYFSLGILIKSKNNLKIVADKLNHYKYTLLLIFLFMLIVIYSLDLTSGYWGETTLISQPISIAFIFGIATMKIFSAKKFLILGRESFSIYLLHMPVAGLITFSFNYYNLWPLTLLRPFFIIAITLSFIEIFKYLSRKFNITDFSNIIIGSK